MSEVSRERMIEMLTDFEVSDQKRRGIKTPKSRVKAMLAGLGQSELDKRFEHVRSIMKAA